MKKVIVATEKATGKRYGYCINSGVDWFAPGLTGLCTAALPIQKAEERIRQLTMQELVRMFRTEKEGQNYDCETVNLKGFTLTLEDPINP